MDAVIDLSADYYSPDYPYGLNTPTADVYLLSSTHAKLMNGGLESFFSHDHPGTPAYSTIEEIYHRVGMTRAARCIRKAASFFPIESVHLRCAARIEFVNQWNDDHPNNMLFHDLDRIIYGEGPDSLVLKYLRDNVDFLPTIQVA